MAVNFRKALAVSATATLFATGASATSIDISFTNSASGGDIFFTPIFTALHNGSFDTFTAGSTANAALESVAEDGAVGGAISNAEAAGAVAGAILGTDGASGSFNGAGQPPLFEPGETSTLNLDASTLAGGPVYFSFLSMILPSNDFFIGNDDPLSIQLLNASGEFLGTNGVLEFDVLYSSVYDAGTELNSVANSSGVLENAPFVFGSAQGPGQSNVGLDENGVVRNVASTAGLTLANLIGTETPGGLIEFVPSGASGNNVLGSFRLEVIPTPVPLPAAAPMLLAALGGMAFVARRKRKMS